MKRLLCLFLIAQTSVCFAFSSKDLWYNKEQQAVENYRNNNFEAAAKQYLKFDNARSHYNRGNALAKMNKFEEAIKAYDEALQKQPSMADAKFNRDLVNKLLQKQKQNQQQKNRPNNSDKNDPQKQQQASNSQNNQAKNDKQEQQQQNNHSQNQQKNKQQAKSDSQDQQKNKQQQASNDSQNQQKNNQEQQQKDKQQQQAKQQQQNKQQQQMAKNTPKEAKESPQQQEQKQAEKQLLNRVPDDPGGLLRRKFARDYQRRLREANKW